MNRKRMWILPLLMLVLAGCHFAPSGKEAVMQPVSFYYLSMEDRAYAGEYGALYEEIRDLGSKTYDLQSFLELYLQGPCDPQARSPFPGQLQILDLELDQGALTIYVTDHWLEQTLLEERLSEACILMTVTQFSEIEQICVKTGLEKESNSPPQYLKPEDILLFDDSATSDQITVKLYFSDTNARYLEEESRSCTADEVGSLPEYIVEQLLKGPETGTNLATLPEGVNLLGIEIDQGVCTVNFSEAFLTNSPDTHAQARMTIFSVVNSLTELSEVESVRFLCVGKEIGNYAGIDLSQLLFREELAIRDPQPSAAVLETTLYVPVDGEKLAAIPMAVRQSSGKMGANAVLSALLSFKPANGYDNPFPDGTALVDQTTRDGLCTVTFNNAFALRNSDLKQLQMSVHAVVATLCALDQIDRVIVQVNDSSVSTDELGVVLMPQSDWFLP